MGEYAAGKKEQGGQVGSPKQNIGRPASRAFEQRTGNPPGGRESGGFTQNPQKGKRRL